jgi:hypothetical protein
MILETRIPLRLKKLFERTSHKSVFGIWRIERFLRSKIGWRRSTRVIFNVSDPKIWKYGDSPKRLAQLDQMRVKFSFSIFYHTTMSDVETEPRKNLRKLLERDGFKVLDWVNRHEQWKLIREYVLVDVIVTSQPYESPDPRIDPWNFNAALVYVPYGFWLTERFDLRESSQLPQCSGIALLESQWHVDQYASAVPNAALRGRACGYSPVYENLSRTDRRSFTAASDQTLLWAPHWTSTKSQSGVEDLAIIATELTDLLEEFDGLRCLYRPHPLLEQYLSRDHTGPFRKLIYQFLEHPSVERRDFDRAEDLFAEADILIHNSGSFVAEFGATAKPVVFTYMSGSFIYDGLNSLGQQLVKGSYLVKSSDELSSTLKNILAGIDTLAEVRKFVAETLRQTAPRDPSLVIVDSVLEIAGIKG